MFHDAFEIELSMLVGTELPGALIVSAFVVLPFTKLTFTCGVAVFVWFASTNTRTHALRQQSNSRHAPDNSASLV